jgi:hypothetical protein
MKNISGVWHENRENGSGEESNKRRQRRRKRNNG